VACALSLHDRQSSVNRVEQPEELDLDHLSVFGGCGVLEGGGHTDTGNAEQHVQPPKFFQRTLYRARGLRLIRYIGFDRQRFTIRAQLTKATPSASIVREAGQSLRSISEGIIAGMLTSPVAAAAERLFRALGLG
jgi:hypothetical protein